MAETLSRSPALTRRLDQALVDRGLAPSRTRAQALIAAGLVRAGDRVLTRPAQRVADDETLQLLADAATDWVSRAALKLVHGLDHFGLDPAGRTVLDIGASTGGFTQVLLGRGADHVYAVDVGHDQLVPALRSDPRVTVLERRNARSLTAADFPQRPDFVTCDASFIGLATILPTPLSLSAPNAHLVALIKPQFEVGPGKVDRGIVRDPALHKAVCDRVVAWLQNDAGWQVLGVTPSPILGGDGNREFLVAATRR